MHNAGDIHIRFTKEAARKINAANKDVVIELINGTFSITAKNFDVLAASGQFTLYLDYHIPPGLLKEKNKHKIKNDLKLKDIDFLDSNNKTITRGFSESFIITTEGNKVTAEEASYDQKSKKWKFKKIK